MIFKTELIVIVIIIRFQSYHVSLVPDDVGRELVARVVLAHPAERDELAGLDAPEDLPLDEGGLARELERMHRENVVWEGHFQVGLEGGRRVVHVGGRVRVAAGFT